MTIGEYLAPVRAVAMDVDGILTDCKMWMDAQSEWRRAFTVRDGIGIKRLICAGYKVAWITGSQAGDIRARAKMLGVVDLYEGKENKTEAFEEFCNVHGLSPKEIAYIGDDLPDLPLLEAAGFSATVPEAIEEVRQQVDYITKLSGGNGAAREFCELVIKHGHFQNQKTN